MSEVICTTQFKIGMGHYLRVVATKCFAFPLGALVVTALVCITVGIVTDLRWIIIAFMLILIVLPMLAAMIYLNYGLRPEGFVNTFPHRLLFREGSIQAEVLFPVLNNAPDSTDEDNEDEPEVTTKLYIFESTRGKKVILTASSLIIPAGNPRAGLLIVPYRTFSSGEECDKVIKYLRNETFTK